MINSVLVTGGSGFIGCHTVNMLVQKRYEVTIFDSRPFGKNNTFKNLNLLTVMLEIRMVGSEP